MVSRMTTPREMRHSLEEESECVREELAEEEKEELAEDMKEEED